MTEVTNPSTGENIHIPDTGCANCGAEQTCHALPWAGEYNGMAADWTTLEFCGLDCAYEFRELGTLQVDRDFIAHPPYEIYGATVTMDGNEAQILAVTFDRLMDKINNGISEYTDQNAHKIESVNPETEFWMFSGVSESSYND